MNGLGIGKIGCSIPSVNAKPATPFDAVQSALAEARELALRVESLADRLLGPVPSAPSSPTGETSSGVLVSMHDDADRTRGFIYEAVGALVRIEATLS